MSGPLAGYRIVELAGIGPGPFAAMMLSDMGAEVLRVDRADAVDPAVAAPAWDVFARGRRSVGLDLKAPAGREAFLRLVEKADAVIEGFRPGVTERLGIGPDDCLGRQPKLIFGRMTGWGQSGPFSMTAGRDINYLALSGTLSMIGRRGEAPVPPLNLVGDFGGGGLLLAYGIVCGILEAARSGRGQVVDAAMVDGAALLAGQIHGLRALGDWGERGTNLLDTGAWFYEVYETADGRYISLGAIDVRAQKELLDLLGIGAEGPVVTSPAGPPSGPRAGPAAGPGAAAGRPGPPGGGEKAGWPAMKARVAEVVRTKTRDEWDAILGGTDVCYAPVLDADEAPRHPHNSQRGTFTEVAGVMQPAPAPRFSRTAPEVAGAPPRPGAHTGEALADWGFSAGEIEELRQAGTAR